MPQHHQRSIALNHIGCCSSYLNLLRLSSLTTWIRVGVPGRRGTTSWRRQPKTGSIFPRLFFQRFSFGHPKQKNDVLPSSWSNHEYLDIESAGIRIAWIRRGKNIEHFYNIWKTPRNIFVNCVNRSASVAAANSEVSILTYLLPLDLLPSAKDSASFSSSFFRENSRISEEGQWVIPPTNAYKTWFSNVFT